MTKIQNEANIVVDRIAKNYKPEKVILFGSVARGEEREGSDIDLLIIKKTDKKRPFRVKEIFESLRGLNRGYSLDPIVYTPDEIDKRLALGDYFIKEVFKSGKVVYGF